MESGWAQHEKEKDEAQDQEAEEETAVVSRPDGQRYIINQYEGDGQMVKRYFEIISEFEELPKDERPVLPKRQTKNSAGYDFYCIRDTLVQKGWGALFRTGIKVHMPPDEHLEIHIRSSYGMKYGMRLANGVGIIDADYYNNPDNEGEILIKLINDGDGDVMIHKGDRFAQGIFVKHYITDNDDATGERVSGVGSTGV